MEEIMATLKRSNGEVSQLRSDAKVTEDFIPGGKPVNDDPTTRDHRVRLAKSSLAAIETHVQLQGIFRLSTPNPPGGER
jgi:hypothetical protein